MIHQWTSQTTIPKSIASLTKLLKMRQLVLGHRLSVCLRYHQYCAVILKKFILIKTGLTQVFRIQSKGYTSNFVDQFQKCCGDVQTKLFCAVNKFMEVESAKTQNNEIRRHCSWIPKYRKINKVRWFWYIEIFIRLFDFIHSLTLPLSYVVPTHITYFPCTF